jgi:hypothetical protein
MSGAPTYHPENWLLSDIAIFWKLFYRGALNMCLYMWGRGYGFITMELQHTICKMNTAYLGRWVGCWWPTAWSQRSQDLTPIDFLLRGNVKEHVYAVPSRAIEELVARLQAAVITVDVKMLRHVRQNSVRRTAVCFEMDGGRFDHQLCLRDIRDLIILLTATCILKTKRLRTCCHVMEWL